MIDVHYFKAYNDQHGHQVGDETLIRLSRFLLRQTRADFRKLVSKRTPRSEWIEAHKRFCRRRLKCLLRSMLCSRSARTSFAMPRAHSLKSPRTIFGPATRRS